MTQPETLPPIDNAANASLALVNPEARADLMDTLNQESMTIDDSRSLYPAEHIGLPAQHGAYQLSVVGEIGVPTERGGDPDTFGHAALVKLRKPNGETRYCLQGLQENEDGSVTAMAGTRALNLSENVPYVLGRQPNVAAGERPVTSAELWADQATYSKYASRRHVELRVVDGKLTVTDMSADGTKIKTSNAPEYVSGNDHEYVAEHTMSAADLARMRGLINERNEFAGRPYITRDTFPVEGAVDIRAWVAGAEATVVDSRNPEAAQVYDKLRQSFLAKVRNAARNGAPASERAMAEAVFNTVSEAMVYDLPYSNRVSDYMAKRSAEHRKINLAAYLADGKGVCRHMALAAAWLGGEARNAGMLPGALTAEVNQHNPSNSAHEWGRYTAADDEVYIIDPAQEFFGTLGEAAEQGRWNYFRAGERAEYMQKRAARQAVKHAYDRDDGMNAQGIIDHIPFRFRDN